VEAQGARPRGRVTRDEEALGRLRRKARVAAACGALQVPGDDLLAALEVAGDRARGPLALGSGARLDRLSVVLRVRIDAVSEVLDALGTDADPARALLAGLGPVEAELRVETSRAGRTTARVEVAADLPLGAALDLLRRVGSGEDARIATREVAEDLGLVRVDALWVEDGGQGLCLPQPLSPGSLAHRQEALGAVCVCVGASAAQVRLHRSLLAALGPPRGHAPVTLRLGPDTVTALSVTYADVAATTVLRVIEQTHPSEHSGARLGALAGAAEAPDRADLEVFAHPGDPPRVAFVFAPA